MWRLWPRTSTTRMRTGLRYHLVSLTTEWEPAKRVKSALRVVLALLTVLVTLGEKTFIFFNIDI